MPVGFNYDKWDKLELSDDEDNHPGAKFIEENTLRRIKRESHEVKEQERAEKVAALTKQIKKDKKRIKEIQSGDAAAAAAAAAAAGTVAEGTTGPTPAATAGKSAFAFPAASPPDAAALAKELGELKAAVEGKGWHSSPRYFGAVRTTSLQPV
jgi:hypothetical protein